MLRVALLNGCKHNYDHDITKLIGSLINGDCVVTGLEVTTWQVSAWYGFLEAIRTATGDSAFVLVSLTEDNTSIDTSGTKKVWITLDQDLIDDASLISENQDNVASLQTGISYPSTPHIKLASISSGTITDERVFISLKQWVNKTLTETITWLKYFSLFPQKSGALTPVNDSDFATKKYIDDLVAQAWAIERLEVLRTLGEDLEQDDTYFVWRGGESFDHTWTPQNLNIWDSAVNLTRYVYVETSTITTILRRVKNMRVNKVGNPTAVLSIYAVAPGWSETLIISTSTWLQLNTDYSLGVDVDATKLKFVASTNDANNYFQIQVSPWTISEQKSNEVSHDIETVDTSIWTTFQEITIETLTLITSASFDFQSTYSFYATEMDWRILKNGVAVAWPFDSWVGNTSAYTLVSASGLNIWLSPWDIIALQLMTPNNRSSWYFYNTKNFKVTGTGSYLAWYHDRWYESWKKYLAKGAVPARRFFDWFESVWGVEWVLTEWVEGGKYDLSFLGPVFLDDGGGVTTTKKTVYIGLGKGDEIEIIRDRGLTVLEYMQDHGYQIKAGDSVMDMETSTDYTASDVYVKVYEIQIQQNGIYRFTSEINSGNTSTSVYGYMGLYKNGTFITEASTNLITFEYRAIDHTCIAWDIMSIRFKTSHTAYSAWIRNKSIRSWWFMPPVTVL
jgi:hypothetical protein